MTLRNARGNSLQLSMGSNWWIFFAIQLSHVLDYARLRLGTDFQLLFRIIKVSVFVAFLTILITLMAYRLLLPRDIFLCMLALIPTGWGLLLVSLLAPLNSFQIFKMYVTIWFVSLIYFLYYAYCGSQDIKWFNC